MTTKKFRDPIYGYIEIDTDIVHDIIDTATFQRLRNIRQTSYGPLYPAALHNRFIHSLGVYHLGRIVSSALRRYADELYHKGNNHLCDLITYDWNRYENLFQLACLLHDVGHSPFSHTGEKFYANSKSISSGIDKIKYNYKKHLAYLTNDEIFENFNGHEQPAPHEIMSCIVALQAFPQQFHNDEEKNFFARCITGIPYQGVPTNEIEFTNIEDAEYKKIREKQIKNCFIKLLHSNIIDVDRLDYIIRDADTIGYQSVSIDYERLLNGVVFVETGRYKFDIGFHKNAVSIIENAVYAHDNEKKWVQGHPIILYDSFLIERSIEIIENQLKSIKTDKPKPTLFSYDSLTNGGSQFGNVKVRFLCDSDLIYLMKNVYNNQYSEEYFNRNTRRIPLWKSEAEFRSLFDEQKRRQLSRFIFSIMGTGDSSQHSIEINKTLVTKIDEDLKESKNDRGREYLQNRKTLILSIFNICKKNDIKEDIVILSTSFFKSNFSKEQIKELKILFPTYSSEPYYLKDVSNTLSSIPINEKELYYLFYYPPVNKVIDRKIFANDLFNALYNAN